MLVNPPVKDGVMMVLKTHATMLLYDFRSAAMVFTVCSASQSVKVVSPGGKDAPLKAA